MTMKLIMENWRKRLKEEQELSEDLPAADRDEIDAADDDLTAVMKRTEEVFRAYGFNPDNINIQSTGTHLEYSVNGQIITLRKEEQAWINTGQNKPQQLGPTRRRTAAKKAEEFLPTTGVAGKVNQEVAQKAGLKSDWLTKLNAVYNKYPVGGRGGLSARREKATALNNLGVGDIRGKRDIYVVNVNGKPIAFAKTAAGAAQIRTDSGKKEPPITPTAPESPAPQSPPAPAVKPQPVQNKTQTPTRGPFAGDPSIKAWGKKWKGNPVADLSGDREIMALKGRSRFRAAFKKARSAKAQFFHVPGFKYKVFNTGLKK